MNGPSAERGASVIATRTRPRSQVTSSRRAARLDAIEPSRGARPDLAAQIFDRPRAAILALIEDRFLRRHAIGGLVIP